MTKEEIPEDVRRALLEFDWPDLGPEIAKAMGKPDWTYKDQSWMPVSDWDKFIDIAGVVEISFIASSRRGDKMRGQFLISPTGIDRVREYASSIRSGAQHE